MMTNLCRERLLLEVRQLEWKCRLTRRTKKRTTHQAFFQKKLIHEKFEARHFHLAYCFLKGTSYLRVEPKCRVSPNLQRIREIISEHCPEVVLPRYGKGGYIFEWTPEWELLFKEWLIKTP